MQEMTRSNISRAVQQYSKVKRPETKESKMKTKVLSKEDVMKCLDEKKSVKREPEAIGLKTVFLVPIIG